MSIKLNKITCLLEAIAPKNLAEAWDNVGLQLGDSNQEISRILLTLDVTEKVVREAINLKVDLIISHHPFIFKGLKTLSTDTLKGRMIKELIENEIAIYVAHTNLDKAELGLNNYVANKLGLTEITSLLPEIKVAEMTNDRNASINNLSWHDHGLGKIGKLETRLSPQEWVAVVKKSLAISDLYGAGKPPKKIGRVGLCTGAGADLMELAKSKKADVFITGDVKYHEGQRAEELGLWLLNAGHFGTEKWVCPYFEALLQRELKEDCPVLIKSQESKDFFEKYD